MTGAWPLTAVIERRTAEGEWIFAGSVRDVETGEAWIARHGLGENHRVREKD